MSSVHLIGGGWDPAAAPALYGPFLDAAGPSPVVATVVLDEGDGAAQAARWAAVLRATAPCDPVPVLVPLGGRLDVAALGTADALLVGGGRDGGVAVCPEEAAEDLEEVTVVPGLGLVPWTVDVHAAQWGTLPRLLTVVRAHGVLGLALDEGTAVHVLPDGALVAGTGTAWLVQAERDGCLVRPLRAGQPVPQAG